MSNNTWMAIMGSSRRHQNTEMIVDYVIDALKAINKDVEKICLSHEDIVTCDGCEVCLNTGECIKSDEMSDVIKRFIHAEGIIIASPTYHKGMSAQTKAFLDRTHFLTAKKDPSFKPPLGIVVGVCKGMTKDAMGTTVEGITTILEALDIEIIDSIEYYNSGTYPVSQNSVIKDLIEQRVIQIIKERGNVNVN